MLMKCPVCGDHIVQANAVEIPLGDTIHRYCSLRCADVDQPGLSRQIPLLPLPAPPRRILVPVDGSGPATRAVTRAASLAAENGAEVEILHAVDAGWLRSLELGAAGQTAQHLGVKRVDVGQVLEADAKVQLAHCERICREVGVKVSTRIETRPAVAAILEASKHVDLVIMGRSGLDAVADTAIGATALRVIAQSSCPVLVVH